MTELITPDELLKLANKTRLTRSEICDILVGMERHHRRALTGRVNSRLVPAQRAAEELAALRMARLAHGARYHPYLHHGGAMTKLITPDELLKLANKIRLTRSEICDILVGMEKHRRRVLTGYVNSKLVPAQRAAEELAALRMARVFIEVGVGQADFKSGEPDK